MLITEAGNEGIVLSEPFLFLSFKTSSFAAPLPLQAQIAFPPGCWVTGTRQHVLRGISPAKWLICLGCKPELAHSSERRDWLHLPV